VALKVEFAELATFLRAFMAKMPIPVEFALADDIEATAANLTFTAEIIAEMPGTSAPVAESMRSALLHTVSALYALSWFAAVGGDWAEMNVRFLLMEAGKALRIAGRGLVADREVDEDGGVQG
jgi:hypothetical protein